MVLIMNRKRVFLLLVSLIMLSFVAGIVSAQNEDRGLGGLAETIEKLFGFIPESITMEKLINSDKLALFYAKFLIWILLFAAIYYGSSNVFGTEGRNIAIVVAFIIALISVLAIPNTIIVNIFQTYSLAAGFTIWFVPVVAGLYLANKIKYRPIKAVFYLVLIFILFSIDKTINTTYGTTWGTSRWFDFFRLLLVVVIVAFFWNLFAMFGGGGTTGWAGQTAETAGNFRRNLWNWMTGGGADGEAGGTGGGGAAGGATTPLNAAELRQEESLRMLLTKIRRKIDDISNNKNPENAKNFISQAMALITANIRNLDSLTTKEIQEDKLNQLEKWKVPKKYHKLIGKEKRLVVQLNNIIQNLSNHLSAGKYFEAKKEVLFAIQIVRVLEKINTTEIRLR